MAAVKTQKKSSRGEYHCGNINCGRKIEPGEMYFKYSFRYGGTHYRCKNHYPKRSELTQSKLADVYAAIEDAEDLINSADNVQDIVSAVEAVASQAQETAYEYQEAAENFGGQGENAERADELEAFAGDLESFNPEDEKDRGEDRESIVENIKSEMIQDGFSEDDDAEWTAELELRIEDYGNNKEESSEDSALQEAKDEAQELLNNFSL